MNTRTPFERDTPTVMMEAIQTGAIQTGVIKANATATGAIKASAIQLRAIPTGMTRGAATPTGAIMARVAILHVNMRNYQIRYHRALLKGPFQSGKILVSYICRPQTIGLGSITSVKYISHRFPVRPLLPRTE